jgi:ABC-2 type transport system ATP-binding protein
VLQYLHVGKSFGSRWSLTRFNAEVKSGEAVRLVGPAGAGKSLLIRMALGEVAPSTGTVHVNGQNPYKLGFGARQRMRRGVSAVLDDEPPLDMPAATWIALGLWCAGRPWADSLDDARRVLDRLALGALAGHPCSDLARGQRLGLALARGLARKPHLLLVDWAGGLQAAPAVVLAELERFVSDGGACLMTADAAAPAMVAGERVVEISAGAGADPASEAG